MHRLWLWLIVGFSSAGLFALGSCGARSSVPGALPCVSEGNQKECQGVCGQGVSTCVAGYWSPCEIPFVERACQDVCGVGLEWCDNETWSACVVPLVQESCENNCGLGVRDCIDRKWQPCRVEPAVRECSFGCGVGKEVCTDNVWGPCDAPPPLPPVLRATIRDFQASHPDFELDIRFDSIETGIVEPELGPDDKPVYAKGAKESVTTSGPTSFDQWFRDSVDEAGMPISLSTSIELRLTTSTIRPEFFVYGNSASGRSPFFPIDGQLFGNYPGTVHNYHFTLEASAQFVYQAGQQFRFNGDDDMWVFINRRLAIDLGGLHSARNATVHLDDIAAATHMVPGERYPLHIFFAERHTLESNFFIETSIADVGQCP